MVIPVPLPPDMPGLDVTVARVESLRPDMPMPLKGGGAFTGYREELESAAETMFELDTGEPAAVSSDHLTYVGGWCDDVAWRRLFEHLCAKADIPTLDLKDGVRCRDTEGTRIWINYGSKAAETPAGPIAAAGVLFEKL
jgi:beta-galactosidase